MKKRYTPIRGTLQAATALAVLARLPDNPGMDFRANLRRLRLAAGLTQEQLAERLGWSQSRLSNYEIPADRDGARTPDVNDAVLIAEALGVPIQALYGDTSHAVKLDPDTMVAALKLTEAMEFGRPKGDFSTWAATLIFCYNRIAAGGQAKLVDQFIESARDGQQQEGVSSAERSPPRKPRR